MLARAADILLSLILLVIFSPVLVTVMFLVFLQDYHSPFYLGERVGKDGRIFKIFKLRSMRTGADKTGVFSTAENDSRITPVGNFIRRFKLDELTQLINVLKGDMSLVGPRPNVKSETNLYTENERKLLAVRPGITDLASVVFADEGKILKDSEDPDRDYGRFIRPWKSRLALFHLENRSPALDLSVLLTTAVSIVSRESALAMVNSILRRGGAPAELVRVAERKEALHEASPP